MFWKKTQKELLPVGVPEFHAWSERIIEKSALPATSDSQKYALANLLKELPPSCHAETDAYFITRLRTAAVKQVALSESTRIYEERKARQEKQNQADATPLRAVDGEVLADRKV
jgi:hypothetical protein